MNHNQLQHTLLKYMVSKNYDQHRKNLFSISTGLYVRITKDREKMTVKEDQRLKFVSHEESLKYH